MASGKKKRTKGRKGQARKDGGGKKSSTSPKQAIRSGKGQAAASEILPQAQAPAPITAPPAEPALPEVPEPAAREVVAVPEPPPTLAPPPEVPPTPVDPPVPEAPPVIVAATTMAVTAGAPESVRARSSKPWRVLGMLALLAALTYAVPGLARFRPWRTDAFEGVLHPKVRLVAWRDEAETLEAPALRPLATGGPDLEGALSLALAPSTDGHLAPGEFPYREARAGTLDSIFGAADIEDSAGSMAHFYDSLARTKALATGGFTRIVHLGDSPIVGDLISGGARERLQRIYGDAGHGWTLPARPWDWYYHYGVTLEARGWRARSPLFSNGGTGRCGLNGVSFTSASPSASSRVASASKGPGSAVSHFWIYYEMNPGAGTLEASVDGEPPVSLPTAGPSPAAAAQDIPVPDGHHTLTLRPKGDGEVTLYGVALEREVPGVIYDSVGTSGGTVRFLSLLDEKDWEESLRFRKPDLVILNFGTNESGYEGLGMGTYSGYLREVIARIRKAAPEASLLVMAPMDRGTRDASGRIVTMATIPKIVATQRAVARETGCAFFDTYQAMGGEGTMARWHQRENPLVTGDLTHPTPVGADYISKLLVDALEQGCAEYSAAQNGK